MHICNFVCAYAINFSCAHNFLTTPRNNSLGYAEYCALQHSEGEQRHNDTYIVIREPFVTTYPDMRMHMHSDKVVLPRYVHIMVYILHAAC